MRARELRRTDIRGMATAAAALMVLTPGVGQAASLKSLPAVAAKMQCTLSAFQALNLNGVADDNGQVTFTTVSLVAASATNPSEYCSVRGVIGPGANSIVMKLPTSAWTQRYVQNGCGGECGNDNLGAPTQSNGCVPVTNGNLVTATTNMGHSGATDGATWSVNKPWAAIDFGYRGVHVASQVAKAVITKFYGQKAAYSYFDGCSDGGREALMSAQRYPNDFDGIAAGAPASDMDVQNTYHHANRVLVNQTKPGYIPITSTTQTLPTDRSTYVLFQSNLPYVHSKVVAACDALDGVADGIIDDPRNCKFNTNALVCTNNGNEAGCLSQAAADVVRKIHDGAVTPDGDRLEPAIATEWGSELDWTLFVPAAQGAKVGGENFVTGWAIKDWINKPYDPTWTINNLVYTVKGFRDTVASSILYAANNPDLTPFARSGGKLILWHGWADQHISPQGTLKYWKGVNEVVGERLVDRFARFYLFPGMGHCGGGLGPNTFDVLTPLMSWVEMGNEPYELVANNTSTTTSRPVYPYPQVARLKAPGLDTKVAANFGPFTPRHDSDVSASFVGNYLFSPGYPQADCTADGTNVVCYTHGHDGWHDASWNDGNH